MRQSTQAEVLLRISMNDALRARLAAKLARVVEQPAPAHLGEATPCRIFRGAKTASGYGNLTTDRKTMGAHRAAYIVAHGSIPAGTEIGHRCDIKLCIEPTHLEAIPRGQNMTDARRRGLLMQKLTAVEVDAIRRWATNLPTRLVAAEFGVTERTVRLIRDGQSHPFIRRPAWSLPGDAMAIARARKVRNGQVQRRVGPQERRHIEAGAEVALVRARLAIDSPAPVIY